MATGTENPDDTLIISVSGDTPLGAPTFTLLVDGRPFGGTYAVTGARSRGEWQDIVVTGRIGAANTIGVTFDNDYAGGVDRTLYVDKITLNGKVYEGEAAYNPVGSSTDSYAALWANGTLTFDTHPVAVTNSLTVRVAARSASGPSQFTVAVDGKQVGGIYGTTA